MNTKTKLFAFLFVAISLLNVQTFAQKKESDTKKKITFVVISTKFGDMKLALYNETPLHRKNFMKLVDSGFYNNVLFHRVIKNFMIQGGDPESKTAVASQILGNGGPGYTIPAEFVQGKYHKKGALAAARMGDDVNPNKESSGSQFYIVEGNVFTEQQLDQMTAQRGMQFTPEQRKIYTTIGGSPWLDNQYTVFGELIEGFDVLVKIASVPVDNYSRPLEDIKMTMKIVVE